MFGLKNDCLKSLSRAYRRTNGNFWSYARYRFGMILVTLFFQRPMHWSYIMLIELNPLRLQFCASNLVLFAQRSFRSPLILRPPFWIEWHCREARSLVSFAPLRVFKSLVLGCKNVPFDEIKLDGNNIYPG